MSEKKHMGNGADKGVGASEADSARASSPLEEKSGLKEAGGRRWAPPSDAAMTFLKRGTL